MDSQELVGKTIDSLIDVREDIIIRLSSGAVVQICPLPDMVVQALFTQYPEPKPPIHEAEVRGKVIREPNLNDPNYLTAIEERTNIINEANLNLVLLRGLKVLELPEDVTDSPDDTEWAEELEDLGVDIPEKKTLRKLLWIKYRVVTSMNDLVKIQQESMKLSGVSEEDIEASMERFQGPGESDADSESTTETET